MKISGAGIADNCLMIGDSLEADIYGAISAGMKAIYYSTENKIDESKNNFITVNSLNQIINILK
jgi:FMN phosphatase YigB (HAD superfamily)